MLNNAKGVLLFVLLIGNHCFGQSTFIKYFYSVSDLGNVVKTNDNNYLIAGGDHSYYAYNARLSKINAVTADTIWQKTYFNPVYDFTIGSVIQTYDKGFVTVGTLDSTAGPGAFLLMKTDSAGNLLWTKSYEPFVVNYEGWFIQQLPDSGFIAGGVHQSLSIYVMRLKSNGDTLWTRTIGCTIGNVSSYCAKAIRTSDGGFALCGYTNTSCMSVIGYGDIFVIKLNSSGNISWAKVYGGSGDELGVSIQQTSDGGYIVAGDTKSFSSDFNICLLKLTSTGILTWSKTYETPNDNYIYDVKQLSNGGYLIAGMNNWSSPFSFSIKTNSIGDTIWTRAYNSFGLAYSILPTTDGGYLFRTADGLMKTDSLGHTGCNETSMPFIVNSSIFSDSAVNPTFLNSSLTIKSPLLSSGSYSYEHVACNLCGSPTTQAKNITFTNVTSNSVTLHWTNGNGLRRIVKVKPTNTFSAPLNGNDYIADSTYTGSGEQIVYNGTGSSVTVAGLHSNVFYWFRVLEVNCNNTDSRYLVSTATNNPKKVFISSIPHRPEEETGDEAPSFDIYPNPAHNVLNVECRMKNAELRIFDMTGRVVYVQPINSQLSIVNCQLNAGTYFVKVTWESGVEVKKLVIE